MCNGLKDSDCRLERVSNLSAVLIYSKFQSATVQSLYRPHQTYYMSETQTCGAQTGYLSTNLDLCHYMKVGSQQFDIVTSTCCMLHLKL